MKNYELGNLICRLWVCIGGGGCPVSTSSVSESGWLFPGKMKSVQKVRSKVQLQIRKHLKRNPTKQFACSIHRSST